MQALRNGSFMSKPTILSIKTLLVIGFYLTNSERMQDAWTLFGLTVRLAHLIKLHRNPDSLDDSLSAHEKSVRRSLWWLMLYLDQHLSVTFAKPMAISNNGDCPPPMFSTTNPEERRLHQFVTEFTIVSRRILSSEGKLEKIAEYTEMLLQLWEMMPEVLRFKEAWVQTESSRPHSPLDVISTSTSSHPEVCITLKELMNGSGFCKNTATHLAAEQSVHSLAEADTLGQHHDDENSRRTSNWLR